MRELGVWVAAFALALAIAPACDTPPLPRQQLAIPPSSVYNDGGPAPPDQAFHALARLPLRDQGGADAFIADVYNPSSPNFRHFMSAQDFMNGHAPTDKDANSVASWLKSQGFNLERKATNNLLIEYSGTVGQFNKAFSTTVHTYHHTGDSRTSSLSDIYVVPDGVLPPHELENIGPIFVTVDAAPDNTPESMASTTIDKTPPPDLTKAFVPAQIARAYGFDSIQKEGGKGGGNTIGLIVADDFKIADAQSLWQAFGLMRKDPTVKVVMEPPATRVVETSLDVEWAGMLAPDADIIVYEAPDIRDTSMLYTWNEAIGLAESTVVSDSFGHRESSISFEVAKAYNDGARMAAAIGISALAATGDSGGVDAPSSCPYVTAVGGSNLSVTPDGTFESETAWFGAGAGESKYFSKPTFQNGVASGSTRRNVADVSLNGQAYYFTKYLGNWEEHGGTSFASPIFGAMVASANSWRASNGKQQLGWLNPALYDSSQNQGIFRDITVGASGSLQAAPGWDSATGWGAPDALALAKAIP